MVAPALALSLVVMASSPAATTSRPHAFKSAGCPVTFLIPDRWAVHVLPSDDEMDTPNTVCTLELVPPDWVRVRQESPFELDRAIEIRVIGLPFPGAAEEMTLEQDDGAWTIVGGVAMSAQPYETRWAKGVRGSFTYETFRNDAGGQQVLAESGFALVSRDRVSVAVTATWDDPDDPVFERLLASLRFQKSR